ncbi:hypothetical protein Poly30_42200 [Planctomycetes bacterium Poly30]|uniref:DUF1579 domain-containing protein n=1 Tax=Saltatorellus ferox TaxID=2528018 RepID=A0A518EX67_9BACT|nr:hypothetical protein Poly30_42200 [Planctomycetes bacterium Poly30]
MRKDVLLISLLLSPLVFGLVGCRMHRTRMRMVEADPQIRASVWDTLRSLEGRWTSVTPFGEGEHVFEVTSMGSVIREIMSPGTEAEMTNMYTLSGNDVAMTHYCGAGNQPYMRASGLDGHRLEFKCVRVGDLKSPGESYMGDMTLVFIDEDHIEQHWTSIQGQERTDVAAFKLTRVK